MGRGVTYKEGARVAYAMDAPFLAKMFDESPEAAQELASIGAGNVLVNGAVTRIESKRGDSTVVMQSNRQREVRCVFTKGAAVPTFSPGIVISVAGKLQNPNPGSPRESVTITDCKMVWYLPDVRGAAGTLLRCASDRLSADARKLALYRGGELLEQAGSKQPPAGCNEAFLLIVNECMQGVARRECQMPWLEQVMARMKGPKHQRVTASAGSMSETQFTKVSLPHGIWMDVPSSWEVNTGAKRVSVREHAEMGLAASSSGPEGARPYIVNLFDSNGILQASLNVFFHEDEDLTQEQVARWQKQEMAGFTREMRRQYGLNDVRKSDINGVVALVGEYRMIIPSGSYRNRAVEVFAGPRSFTLTIGYLETGEKGLKDVCDRVIWSLRMER